MSATYRPKVTRIARRYSVKWSSGAYARPSILDSAYHVKETTIFSSYIRSCNVSCDDLFGFPSIAASVRPSLVPHDYRLSRFHVGTPFTVTIILDSLLPLTNA